MRAAGNDLDERRWSVSFVTPSKLARSGAGTNVDDSAFATRTKPNETESRMQAGDNQAHRSIDRRADQGVMRARCWEQSPMTPLQKQIEDIKDALASIEENGECRVGEAERLLAWLAALEKELARFIGALPAHNDGRAG